MIKDCLYMSAIEISRQISIRQLSAFEVVSSHIERASQVNARINAIVNPYYENALAQAKVFDRMGKTERELFPLLGVPFTVKESIAASGRRHTSGSWYRRHDIAQENAPALARLLKAGAILLGQTNLSELALWPECGNVIYGVTANPHNLKYTSGGSSGGDGAIVSAGGAPFALGTDGGGSVRIPAAHCGVFGHKPSSKRVPMTGHFPLDSYSRHLPESQFISRFFSMGLLCRRAEDLLPLLNIISGADGFDKNIDNSFRQYPLQKSFRNIKVYLLEQELHYLLSKPDKSITHALYQSAEALQKEGAIIAENSFPFLADACELWLDIIATAKNMSLHSIVNQQRSLLLEFIYIMLGKRRIMPSTLLMLLMDKLISKNKKTYIRFMSIKNKISARLNHYLDGNALLLLPTYPTTAIKHGRSFSTPFDFLYSGIFNVLELPATTIPVGLSENGLPASVQVVAAHGYDHLPISAAAIIERECGGWILPSFDLDTGSV